MRAFSLVELSIVLVILGLLTGGILAGQSLIRASELRSAVTQYQGYVAAVRSFQSKYFSLPGDMANATKFWGGPPTNCTNTATTDKTTCDGDGDGVIDYENNTFAFSNNYYEGVRAWQHLSNAEMVGGNYTGADEAPGLPISYVAGKNAPAGKISNTVWRIFYTTPNPFPGNAALNWAPSIAQHNLMLSSVASSTAAILRPQEMWNIDTKTDDGLPNSGRIQDIHGTSYTPNCASSDAANGMYNLSLNSVECVLMMGF